MFGFTKAGLLCAALLIGCGGGHAGKTAQARSATPAQQQSAPTRIKVDSAFWVPGEQMFWTVSMHGLVGIEAVLAVGKQGVLDGRSVVIVRSRAVTSGLARIFKKFKEETTTWVDLRAAAPTRREFVETTKGKVATITTVYRQGTAADHRYVAAGGATYSETQKTPAGEIVLDNLSILGLLRAWSPAPGAQGYFYAITDQALHLHIVRYVGSHTLKTRIGVNPARQYRVDVYRIHSHGARTKRASQSYSLWFSDDASRRPLLMAVPHRFGRVKMELIDYRVTR